MFFCIVYLCVNLVCLSHLTFVNTFEMLKCILNIHKMYVKMYIYSIFYVYLCYICVVFPFVPHGLREVRVV